MRHAHAARLRAFRLGSAGLCALVLAGLAALAALGRAGSARAAGSEAACGQCRAIPPLCKDLVHCVKDCGATRAQAKSCLDLKYVDAARYTEATGQPPPSAQRRLCEDTCRAFPPMCRAIAACIKACGVARIQARNCLDNEYIDAATYTEATGEPAPAPGQAQAQAK